MSAVWDFTDLEFVVLLERYTNSTLPVPFSYTSRTRWRDDYEREKFETWERLRATVDGSIRDVLETCARPEVFVVVHGWDDADITNPAKRIRARAVRSGMRGYLVTQRPGETLGHSGGFTVTECGPHGLADAVVRALPRLRAGRYRNIPIMTDRADDREQFRNVGSLVTAADRESPARQSERFFRTRASLTGAITIHQGHSKFGPRGILEQFMLWRDLPDDGRYAFVLDHAPVANGVRAEQLAAMLENAIEAMLDRSETHWEVPG